MTPCVVLRDYAHTPDALERALATLRPAHPRTADRRVRLRRRSRPRQAAAHGPDRGGAVGLAIVTADNPRTEDPERIIDDIEQGMGGVAAPAHRGPAARRSTRRSEQARPGDTMLLAGKGHETYQVIGTEKRALRRAGDRAQRGDAVNAGGETPTMPPWTERDVREALRPARRRGRLDIHRDLHRHADHRSRARCSWRWRASGSMPTTSSRPPRPAGAGGRGGAAQGRRRCPGLAAARGARHAAGLRRAGAGTPAPELTGPVVAVTGTNGKTSTKEMLAAALRTR